MPLQKIHCIISGQTDFFPYDLGTVNECLSDTLEKAKSGIQRANTL